MFKFLWKMIKWSFILIVVLFCVVLVMQWNDPEVQAEIKQDRIAKCLVEIGAGSCDENGYETQESKDKRALIEIDRKAKADAIAAKAKAKADARIAAAKAIEDRTYNITKSGRLMCRYAIKQLALYPSELKFNYFKNFEEQLWENFNKDSSMPHRYSMNVSGKWMNRIGMMVPFNAHCKLDLPTNGNGKIVDIWIK